MNRSKGWTPSDLFGVFVFLVFTLVISVAFIWPQAWQYEKSQLTDWENINATYFPTGYVLDQLKLLDFSLFRGTPAVNEYSKLQLYNPQQFHNISSAMTKALRWLGVGLIVESVCFLLIVRLAQKQFWGKK
jgi:hypothetical protein